jgi:opacity protein-like surface antigen
MHASPYPALATETKWRFAMKKLALIAALAMTFASQAFAQSYDHDFGSGNIANPVQADGTNGQFGVGTGALDSGSYDTSPNASAPRRVRRAQSMQAN